MKAGDLINFKCIGAGRHDNPPYSLDGEWRVGLLINLFPHQERSKVLYMGEIFTLNHSGQLKILEDENEAR